ncbi:hypothetical protein AACH10_20940 [Ideonella sp. DXS22W]|uniref:Pathogenicity locus n=1 Tax=Pseudaquabacterium inlustre TaxID=2984192 RepID=A0ABU9CNK3_9BURK
MPFTVEERNLLIATPRLGPAVVQRLEQVGLDSLAKLRASGVDAAVARVCQAVGSGAWANRRRALRVALASLAEGPDGEWQVCQSAAPADQRSN